MKEETKNRLEHDGESGAAGALAGAVIGAVAGPVGAIAGAIIGAAAGSLLGDVTHKDGVERDAKDAVLDGEIGVSGGEMGAPNLAHPRSTVGAFSGGSSGGASGGADDEPAEGPMQSPST
jgi:phage tail tape-measure protein